MSRKAVSVIKIKNKIDTGSVRNSRDIAKAIFSYFTKREVLFVESKFAETKDTLEPAIKYTYYNEDGIIQIEKKYLQLCNQEMNNFILFENIFVTDNPLIYLTNYFKKGFEIRKNRWGFTIPSSNIPYQEYDPESSFSRSVESIALDIQTEIFQKIDEGFSGFPLSEKTKKLSTIKDIRYVETIENFYFVQSDIYSAYEIEQMIFR